MTPLTNETIGPVMHTERLILRAMQIGDAEHLFPLINDFEVAKNMLSIPHPYPDGAFESWITLSRDKMRRGEQYEMAIVVRETGLPIGACSLMNMSAEHNRAEIGYWLGRPYWGRGYMTEAVKALVRFAFEDLKLERVYARCFGRNPASGRVLQKAGLKFEGCARHDVCKYGEFIDMLSYGIIRSDYEAAGQSRPD